MTIKDILNNVLAQSGFLEKGSFFNSADPDDKQMVAISNRVAYEIMNFYPWNELRSTFQIDMQTDQNRYVLPADYQSLIANSAWETDGSRIVEWPVPDRRWFMYKFTTFSDGGTIRVRKYGNEIEVHDPEGGESFTFEYVSKWVAKTAEGERTEFFTNDTDEFLLDDQMLVLGVQAHWQQAKLMPSYQEHNQNYRAKMNEAIGRSNGSRTIGGNVFGRWQNTNAPYYPLYRK